MQVYKFGGASIADAERMQNVASIIQNCDGPLLVVISAIAQMTNRLEEVVRTFFEDKERANYLLQAIKQDHFDRCKAVLSNPEQVMDTINNHFVEAEWILDAEPIDSYDYVYDQIVSLGELASTTIMSALLNEKGVSSQWEDVRGLIRTSRDFRDAKIDWEVTKKQITTLQPVLENQVVITQGFIGCTSDNETSTLGREGSDFSGAIFSYCLEANKYTIWKDVTGVYTADPNQFDFAQKIEALSYQEAVEMAYYGAKVIHPKTIKPLQNKGINLTVRSFTNQDQAGTLIGANESLIPNSVFIEKENQVKVSFTRKDFAFFEEHDIGQIMHLFEEQNISIQLVQRSAIQYTIVTDYKSEINSILGQLMNDYLIKQTSGLELQTLRHYKTEDIERLRQGKNIVIEQRNELTYQVVFVSS